MAGFTQADYLTLLKKAVPKPSGRGGGMSGARKDHQESVLRDYRAGKPMPKSDYTPPPVLQPQQLPQQNPMAALNALAIKQDGGRRQRNQPPRRPAVHPLSGHLNQLMSGQVPMQQRPQPLKDLFAGGAGVTGRIVPNITLDSLKLMAAKKRKKSR